ncbi:ABC transporter permease [Actinoplanes aureus]|uniref:ABC transporter permease n=1 Tax=Actinoplanes aureus TaxID=2792083 RepID=UPI0035A1844E
MAAEFLKVRTLRSTWAFLGGGVAASLLGAFILFMLVQSYDAASPANKLNYETADPTVVTMPFVMFFIGAIGAMLITSEFGTRSIGPALLALAQRRTLIGAKATVAGFIGLTCGAAFVLLAFADARLMLGNRPTPINPWPRWTDAIPTVLCATVIVTVTALVAMGLGALLRSTAGTLTTLGSLVLVAPIFAHFLPTVWQLRLASVLLPNLTPSWPAATTRTCCPRPALPPSPPGTSCSPSAPAPSHSAAATPLDRRLKAAATPAWPPIPGPNPLPRSFPLH